VNGVGAPASRFIFTVSYEPPEVRDRDLDGLVDRIDECPSDPEDFDQFEDEDGCPELDNDGDGLVDTEDACPNEPEDFDTWLDSDGCPEPEVPVRVRVIEPSGSSIASANTRVSGEYGNGYDGGEFTIPLVAGTYELKSTADGFSSGSTSVTVDAVEGGEAVIQLTPHIPLGDLLILVTGPDGARIPNATFSANGGGDLDIAADAMKMRPGDYEFLILADGYKPVSRPGTIRDGEETRIEVQLAPARVVVTRTRIDLSEKVYFDTNKATIKAESFGLLDEVATVLMDHPEIIRIRIEGHTDSRGSDKYNLELSKSRAASVLDYLVSKGVETERLESEGFGESKPLDTKQNAKAWEMNRRVDIFITERTEN
ncbi:MAG: OmpA family protein, partial [Proteobacteria bacterium]|nr:OmpA family protein [Pseudomonadota bacterium]